MTIQKCNICNSTNIDTKYKGDIRNGKFPNIISNATIYNCLQCGVEFLSNYNIDYTTSNYRELVDSESSEAAYYKIHDNDQYFKLSFFKLNDLRDKKIVDIGCGAGSFLDLVQGYVSETTAIEPAKYYHESLSSKGHIVYDSINDLLLTAKQKFDFVTIFSVIEHVDDPLDFILSATRLLKKGGKLILSTPNANDLLLKLIPEEYSSFFYRVVHKWYFNKRSLTYIFNKANLKPTFFFKHRFGLSNVISWCKDKKPNCPDVINLNESLDNIFKSELESKEISDYIYIVAEK